MFRICKDFIGGRKTPYAQHIHIEISNPNPPNPEPSLTSLRRPSGGSRSGEVPIKFILGSIPNGAGTMVLWFCVFSYLLLPEGPPILYAYA